MWQVRNLLTMLILTKYVYHSYSFRYTPPTWHTATFCCYSFQCSFVTMLCPLGSDGDTQHVTAIVSGSVCVHHLVQEILRRTNRSVRPIDCCWSSSAQSYLVQSPSGLVTIFHCFTTLGIVQFPKEIIACQYLLSIWRGRHRKRRVLQFCFCFVCIRCRGNMLTEFLCGNFREGQSHRQKNDFISLLSFFQNKVKYAKNRPNSNILWNLETYEFEGEY
jgi:hypothetical protein